MINVAINGFGRIGRNILRAYYERPEMRQRLRIVAINDLGTPEINAHLLQFDTTHGRFGAEVVVDGGDLLVNCDRINVYETRTLPVLDALKDLCEVIDIDGEGSIDMISSRIKAQLSQWKH